MALTADSSEDEGEGLNQEIPQFDRAAYDTLLTAVQKAGFNIGTFLQVLFVLYKRLALFSHSRTIFVSRKLVGSITMVIISGLAKAGIYISADFPSPVAEIQKTTIPFKMQPES